MTTPLRLLLILVAGAVAVAGVGAIAESRRPPEGVLLTEDGITVAVTEEARAAGVRFGGGFPAADREWVLAALAQARPEAAALLAEIDGLVTVSALPPELEAQALGRARGTPTGFSVELALGAFNGDAAGDRTMAVLHEFGHVIDFALVDDQVGADLDAQIPREAACGVIENCDAREERFADTFAKWALRGAVSEVGAGYGIPMPASLETWGEPLTTLARSLPK